MGHRWEYPSDMPASAKKQFGGQYHHALARGIEWLFSPGTWWNKWQDSGRYEERGRGQGQYVMCRFGDAGPYSPENTYIATTGTNLRDANTGRKHPKSFGENVSARVRVYSDEDIQTVLKMRGCHWKQVAATTGMSQPTIHRIWRFSGYYARFRPQSS